MNYIGLDVHKTNTAACVVAAGGKVVKTFEVRSSQSGLRVIHDCMGTAAYCVMMESSTYSYPVYRFFESLGVEAHVVHARSLKMITQSTKKTDRNDAEAIATMLRLWKNGEVPLSMSYIPTPEQMELKDVCRYCEELSGKLGDEVRRIRSHLSRNCRDLPVEYANLSTRKSLEYVRAEWPGDVTLQMRMEEYHRTLKEYRRAVKDVESRLPGDSNVDLLMGIMGIGRRTAVQMMSMIVDIKRFEDAEKICAYFGMVPGVRNSGGKDAWYDVTGYRARWKVETAFSSLKKLFGETLRARSAESLDRELAERIERYNSYKVACHV